MVTRPSEDAVHERIKRAVGEHPDYDWHDEGAVLIALDGAGALSAVVTEAGDVNPRALSKALAGVAREKSWLLVNPAETPVWRPPMLPSGAADIGLGYRQHRSEFSEAHLRKKYHLYR